MSVPEYQLSFHFQHVLCLHQWNLLLKGHREASGPKGPEVQGDLVVSAEGLLPSEAFPHRCGAYSMHGGKWPTMVLLAKFHC